jgi:hypothetical protein
MHRPGCDPDAMDPQDFLCDFCGHDWTRAGPFVEGHHGACICGGCLHQAMQVTETASERCRCNLCLQERQDAAWSRGKAHLCGRCREQAARVLGKDAESDWSRS